MGARLAVLEVVLLAAAAAAPAQDHAEYVGIVSWCGPVRTPNRLAAALRGAALGAANTPQPSGPEGAGGGISRTAQGANSAQQQAEYLPKHSVSICFIDAPSITVKVKAKRDALRVGDKVHFVLKGHSVFLDKPARKLKVIKVLPPSG